MFAENFNHPATSGMSLRIPLEISIRMSKHRIQFITLQFVRREYANTGWIIHEGLIDEIADSKHTGSLRTFFNGKGFPISNFRGSITSICLDSLTHLLLVVHGNDFGD